MAAAEPEPETSPPPPKRVRAPRRPKAAAEQIDQPSVPLPVVDASFLADLSGTLRTMRRRTREEKISSLQIAYENFPRAL